MKLTRGKMLIFSTAICHMAGWNMEGSRIQMQQYYFY